MDPYTDREGKTHEIESMWPYVADIQRDFAARAAWVDAETFEKGEHAPALILREGLDHAESPEGEVILTPEASSPDGAEVILSARIYAEASAPWAT